LARLTSFCAFSSITFSKGTFEVSILEGCGADEVTVLFSSCATSPPKCCTMAASPPLKPCATLDTRQTPLLRYSYISILACCWAKSAAWYSACAFCDCCKMPISNDWIWFSGVSADNTKKQAVYIRSQFG